VKPGFAQNLARRVGTAVVALPLLLLLLFKAPPVATVALIAAAVLLGAWELGGMLQARGLRPLWLPGAMLLACAFATPLMVMRWSLWPAAMVLLLAATLLRATDLPTSVPAAAGTTLAASYLGALGGTLAALRVLPVAEGGAWRMVMLLAVVMANDTFAYFTGSAIGRRKLAPTISPGKTIEGTLGGVVGAVIAALLVQRFGLPGIPVAHAALLGVAVAVLGTVGDLVESLLKRWAGVKDSGHLFPGHGGMLDRLDSLLFGAPALYYYFALLR
jgi:phosphatidate cytidylyltransferase